MKDKEQAQQTMAVADHARPKRSSKSLVIVLIAIVLLITALTLGGYYGYKFYISRKSVKNNTATEKTNPDKIDGKIRPGSNPDTTERQPSPAYF